jgi:ribosomal protein L11 methyltransferase
MDAERPDSWAVVEFETAAENEELAGWVMMQECGATACEVKSDPAKANSILLQATFQQPSLSDSELQRIARVLTEHAVIASPEHVRRHQVHQQDWLAKWKEGFKPFQVGERLLICPIWEVEAAAHLAVGRKVLLVEPGMAFGTGLHATTQYCLKRIESEGLGPHILDVGTGSGILAIAAVLLDANTQVTAIDNDQVAIEVAQQNCKLNRAESQIRLVLGTTAKLGDAVFDDILSNITCEDIISLLPDYERLLKPGGSIVCAGVLAEKREMLENGAAKHGFFISHSEVGKQWCGLTLQKHA